MDPIRIGEKIINRSRIHYLVDEIVDLRMQGFSQQEVAKIHAIDRTFISRLESLGEIRKGGRVALVAFPVSNRKEIVALAEQVGIEYVVIFSEEERWAFLRDKNGVELFNAVMKIVGRLRESDVVIVAASNMRINLAKTLLDKQVVGLVLGESPIEEDKYLEPQLVQEIMESLKKVSSI
ncbi:MAG TPA: transcriptional regulator [Candidatus Avacidaminococcus intestinavium]|uniref:Transcriptional regulator n=1 Tax=Candidatus Avacidaminococcus intestinavium TaxID=2840684 RepID=A0A9D1MPC9_9FIRM|nr:transcriptional regulator [Candidatus Avacidaminococcus intestinavium]